MAPQLRHKQAERVHRLAQIVARDGEKARLVLACFRKLSDIVVENRE